MALIILSEYETQKEVAIEAWNEGTRIKEEIKARYSKRGKDCVERFDSAINKMVVILFDENKVQSVNQALNLIASDIQDRCESFPKSLRGLSAHLTDETRELLQKRVAQVPANLRNEIIEESSTSETAITPFSTEQSQEQDQEQELQTTLETPTVLSDLELFQNIGYHPRPYDVWNFQMDDRFGMKYPGNIPAGIVFNTLYFFSGPGDTIVDPMAGGGVVGDCCKEVNRRCAMYDIQPARSDITEHDVTQGLPAESSGADLLFWDPPYYKKMQRDYGNKSISSLDKKQYLSVFEKVAKDAYSKGIKKIAFLMSNYDDEYNDSTGASNIFIWDYIEAITKSAKWRVHREVQCPLSTQQISAHQVTPYIEEKKLHRLTRSLILFVRC